MIIFLGGVSIKELNEFGIKDSDLQNYLPMNMNDVEKIILRYIFSYYLKWHNQSILLCCQTWKFCYKSRKNARNLYKIFFYR